MSDLTKTWYYEKNGQQVGPFRTEGVPQLVQAGIIHRDTMLFDQSGQCVSADTVGASVSSPTPPASATVTTMPTRASHGGAGRGKQLPMFCAVSLLIGVLASWGAYTFDSDAFGIVAFVAYLFGVLALVILMKRGSVWLLMLLARAAGILEAEREVRELEVSPVRGPTTEGLPSQGLAAKEYAIYFVVFLCVPILCVCISSGLYYGWKASQPKRAHQINTLGFLVFGLHMGSAFLFIYSRDATQ